MGEELHLVYHGLVPLIRGYQLILPARYRMGRSGRDAQAFSSGKVGYRAAQLDDIGARFLDIGANTCAHFDHRLVHLGLDLLAEHHDTFVYHLGYVRAQLPRHRVYDLKFFFNPERKIRHLGLL